jgi:hypothetical protein
MCPSGKDRDQAHPQAALNGRTSHRAVVMRGNVDGSSAANFIEEVNQAISDLGLQAKLKCEVRDC